MSSNNKKKAVVTKTQPEDIEHQVRFEPKRFNSLVYDKGYEVFIDKALRCPCAVKGAGQALPSCNNCLGVGWVYIDRKQTRVAIQGMNADVKYENWSKLMTGMARITARATDKLAFMDRVVLREAEGYYNEILRSKDFNGKKTCFTTYQIVSVETIFLFKGDKVPLYRLSEGEYLIDEEKITLNNEFKNLEDFTISIRYKHLLTYHVIDMNRDLVKVRTKDDCEMEEELIEDMPISCVARKAHYLFDNLSFEQSSRLLFNDRKPDED